MHINTTRGISTAILLAAGTGSRLSPLTDDVPKCLTQVNGVSILERLIRNLTACNINRLVVVVGRFEDCIRDYLSDLDSGIQIDYVCNEKYSTTNNIYSLWKAQHLIDEPVLLVECDLIFDDEILASMVTPNRVAVSAIQPWMNGTTISLDADHRAIQFHTSTDPLSTGRLYKTVNVYSFSQVSWQHVKNRIETVISDGRVNDYYETVLAELVAEKIIQFTAVIFDDTKWDEIDTHEDLQRAEKLFLSAHTSKC